MNFPPRRTPRAFTLVELLTVIAIIAILMGLLFPTIAIVIDRTNRARAKNDVSNIVTAVRAYHAEYGKYPSLTEIGKAAGAEGKIEDAICGDTAAGAQTPNNTLFNTLRAIPEGLNAEPVHGRNLKKLVFFEGRPASKPAQPRGGFADNAGADAGIKGSYFDPWGRQYTIVIDQNSNNVINLRNQYTDFTDKPGDDTDDIGVRTGVGAFSMGKDNALGKKGNKVFNSGNDPSDDIASWQ